MWRLSLVLLMSLVVVLTAVFASAASLVVDGGTLQVFTFPANIEVPPSPPSDLDCEKLGFLHRRLTWGPAPAADGYRIYHDGPFWDDDFHLLAQVEAPATTYDRVWPSFFHHRWYVTASLGSWESEPSNVIEVHCRPAVLFPGPCDLHGDNHHSQRTVRVTWQPTPGAARYGVFRADQSGGPYDMAGITEGTTYDDSAVTDGATYYYVVVGVDAEGRESDPSAEIAVSDVLPVPPAGPEPEPTLGPTATPEPAPMATPSPTPTLTPEPLPTPEPTATPEPTSTPGP